MTGQYKAYPEYKDSGVEWLGEIPEHWRVVPLGRMLKRIKRIGHAEKELLSVSRELGVIPASSRAGVGNKPSEDLYPYQLVRKNEIVVNKMQAWRGSVSISDYEGIVSPAYFVYEPFGNFLETANHKYIHYLLRTPIYIAQYLRYSRGIRVMQWDLVPHEFELLGIIIPKMNEQIAISGFLDKETLKIDNLVSAQESLITLLKEKRQAMISHVVTKGLDPNIEMKDSGVEWQGDAPRHWILGNLNRFGTFLGGSGFPIDAQGESTGDIPFYKVSDTNIPGNEKYLAAANNYISFDVAKSLGARIAPSGGIMFPKVGAALLGNKRRILFERAITDNNTMVFIPKDNNSEFWYYALLIMDFGQLSNPGPVPSVNESQLKRFEYVAPSAKERSEIADYLNAKLPPIETLITEVQESIDLLKEHRAALISAAVTGKIDVRDWEVNA